MNKTFINLIFLTSYLISFAQVDRSIPESGPAPKINFEEPVSFELKNGLKVMFIENRKLPRASVNLLIDNPPIVERNLSGVGIITGGIMGKGNTFQDKDNFNEEVDFMGARMNFSSQGGAASSLSRYFERVLTMFAQGALYPNFSEEEFDQEKNILLDNIKNNDKNTVSIARRVENVLAYGANHPYGEFTTIESMENIKLSDVTKFYDDYFKPNNAYLVIIGDFNIKNTEKLVKKLFGKWKNDKSLESKFAKGSENEIIEPKEDKGLSINVIDMPNSANSEITFQNLVNLKKTDDDYYSALIANRIFGAGPESRLFNNIREDKGYAYGAYSSISDNKYSKAKFRASTSTRAQVTDSALVEIIKEIEKNT
jgi:predicted Zn-dependent peptidase